MRLHVSAFDGEILAVLLPYLQLSLPLGPVFASLSSFTCRGGRPLRFFFDIAASYPSISLGAVANQLTFLLSEITLTLRKFAYLT